MGGERRHKIICLKYKYDKMHATHNLMPGLVLKMNRIVFDGITCETYVGNLFLSESNDNDVVCYSMFNLAFFYQFTPNELPESFVLITKTIYNRDHTTKHIMYQHNNSIHDEHYYNRSRRVVGF